MPSRNMFAPTSKASTSFAAKAVTDPCRDVGLHAGIGAAGPVAARVAPIDGRLVGKIQFGCPVEHLMFGSLSKDLVKL